MPQELRRLPFKLKGELQMKNAVSRFGKSLSGMVMPNIGAFIAWGFLTALFIEAGWFPNEKLASMVSPMLTYLLPILIAGQGGKMIAGDRGRVIAAIAVVGCICGSDYTMLMGAMVMGPLAGWVIKQFDKKVEGHIPAGFEMLINNFSIGILGMLLAILGYYVIGPFMTAILTVLTAGVDFLVAHSLLPLVSIFIEPAKVLFLNNAINHGIFSPIGASQAAETGRSIMYMLEANPGPGLGVLLAYCFFCKDDTTRQSAPGAVIIHLLGGIHEIYFPYILMNPVIIIAPIVGNFCAILFYSMTGAGLSGPASPGSIIAYMAMAPRDSILTVLLGVVIAGAVSFILSSVILKATSGHTKSLTDAQNEMKEMKAQAKGEIPEPTAVNVGQIRKIVFACDAGMGSSAMGATKFHNRIKAERPDLTVTNTSVDTIPADADVVVCQRILADRAAKSAPQAQLVTLDNFLADPHLDALYNALTSTAPVLDAKAEAAAKEQIEWGLHQADIIKISDEEVDFLWGLSPQESAQKLLTEYGASLVYVTLGPKGCYFANRNCTGEIASPAEIHVVDTTGVGDIFGGSAMSRFLKLNKTPADLTKKELTAITTFACCAASLSTQKHGGITSVVPEAEVRERIARMVQA